jgi:hypothetical protein
MTRLRLAPRALDSRKEADSGLAQMMLLPACARSAGARPSSRLVVLPSPRATPSAVGALVVPRRSPPPGSRATTWSQRQDSATPAESVAVRQRQRLLPHSLPCWRVGCCRVPARAPVALVRGRVAGRQPDGAHAGHHFPHGAPPAQGYLVQAVGRVARHPCPALGEEGPSPRRASAELAPIRSCSRRRPRRRCIPAWIMPSRGPCPLSHCRPRGGAS